MAHPFTRVAILRADEPGWEEWLRNVPRDVYHSAGYHTYAQGSGEGDPYLIVVGDMDQGLAWPYLLRPVSEIAGLAGSTAMDVSSVYGYPGPLAWGCQADDPFLEHAWSEVLAIWREQGAVAAFTRFHPLLNNAAVAAGFRTPGGPEDPVGPHGQTVSVDLTLGHDAARAAYGRDLRREIDQSRRGGLTTFHDTEWTELGSFARLYNDTMLRLRASDFYFFDEADFARLRDALAGDLHLLVAQQDGIVAAAGLFTEWHGIVEWYLVGTDSAFMSRSPSKVLVDDAIHWAIDRHNRVLHLGGGRGSADDSLLWFKSRFSHRRHAFHTGRWILDAERYAELNSARSARLAAGAIPDRNFFPAYRAPIVGSDPDAAPSPGPASAMKVRRVGPEDAGVLADLLGRIDDTYFKPHPMTPEEADRISTLLSRDIYLIGTVGDEAVAYGMLRGWDEGFEVPSLGIGVRKDREHMGYGRAMMQALHDAVRAAGSSRVRLRVSPENVRAARLYRALNYREVGMERGEIVMILDL